MLRDLLQQLNFGHRMVLYRLLVVLFLAGMIYYAFFVPGGGERAFKRAMLGASQAKSWKYQYARPAGNGLPQMDVVVEMACPSSYRMTQNWTKPGKDGDDTWSDVRMTSGGASYFFNSKEAIWHRDDAAGRSPAGDCQAFARGEDSDILPPLHLWTRFGSLQKGGVRDAGPGQCQEWRVNLPPGPTGPNPHGMVCLGVEDGLPRFADQDGVAYRYFDWNVPIDFSPPEIAQAPQNTSTVP